MSLLEDCTRPGVPLVLTFCDGGVELWPLSRIAMLRVEWEGRVEATSCEGRVAHHPGPLLSRPPMHEVAPGCLVNPTYARPSGDGLEVPGGWRLPLADLPAPTPASEPDPGAVMAAVRQDGRWSWLTLAGALPGPTNQNAAKRAFPDLVRAGPHLVRPGAIRRLARRGPRVHVGLEGGHVLEVGMSSWPGLCAAVGLPSKDPLAAVPPAHRRVYELGLRDWPSELLAMPDEFLRQRYAENPRRLVDDVIWERFRRGGRSTDIRGLFYNPLKALAGRAGLWGRRAPRQPWGPLRTVPRLWPLLRFLGKADAHWTPDRLCLELQIRLDFFVGEWRLLTYGHLGLSDNGHADRHYGTARPHVILLVEKRGLREVALAVARRFGFSMLVLGGYPTWIGTEFFVEYLRGVTDRPVLLVSYCDFDPYGWSFPVHFARQLARYGVATEGIVRLVKPSCFTTEELERIALDLPAEDSQMTEEWMRETGGVNGRARGIHADFLEPAWRVEEAVRRETGLEPLP